MPEYVRVRLENGSHKTLSKAKAEAAGLKPLKQDATGRDGRPLPPKTRTPIGGAAAAKPTTTHEASASKESQED